MHRPIGLKISVHRIVERRIVAEATRRVLLVAGAYSHRIDGVVRTRVPAPDSRRSTADSVVYRITVLHRVPPSPFCRIDIGIGLHLRRRIRLCRVVNQRNRLYRLGVREVRTVGALDLKHIPFHHIRLVRMLYLPAQLLVPIVHIPFPVLLVAVLIRPNRKRVYPVISRYIHFVGPNPTPRRVVARALLVKTYAEAANHRVRRLDIYHTRTCR